MSCNPLTDPTCVISGTFKSLTGHAGTDALTGIAHAIDAGVRWMVASTATWWVQISSPDLATEPAVTRIQQWLLPITIAVAVGGVIAAGARMALTRRANPLIDVTGGLLTIAAVSTIGVTVATLLLKAGDAWSGWVLQAATGGHFVQRLTTVLELGSVPAAAVMVVFGLVAIVMSLIQAVLMLFRQAALLILAGVLPLAAAGAIAPMTRTWVRKVTAWMLALICYKPAAAAVYAVAFTMIGAGHSLRTVLMGFVMLMLSVLTLPALMKFFTWTTGSIATGGGGGQLINAATLGAIAIGALRSGGSGARDQAANIDNALGTPPSGSAPGSPPGPPPSGPDSSGSSGAGGGPAGSAPAGTGARPAWPSTSPGSSWPPWSGAGTGSGNSAGSVRAGSGPGTAPPEWGAPGGPGTRPGPVAPGELPGGAMEPGNRA